MAKTPIFDKATLAWNILWNRSPLTAVTFLGSSQRLATANAQGHLLLWKLPEKPGATSPVPIRRLDGHTNGITGLAATPDGRWLISASYDRTVRFWDLNSPPGDKDDYALVDPGEAKREAGLKVGETAPVKLDLQKAARVIDVHKEWVRGLALTPDGKHLFTGDDSGQAYLWSVPEARQLRHIRGEGWFMAVGLSPDGREAVTNSFPTASAGTLAGGLRVPTATLVWDLTTGKVKRDMTVKEGNIPAGVEAVAYSPDGRWIAMGIFGSRKMFLVDAATGKKVRDLAGMHQWGTTGFAFHPDGKHLASSGRDNVVKFWRLEDGKLAKELGTLRKEQTPPIVHAISISPDGRRLTALLMPGFIQIWQFGD